MQRNNKLMLKNLFLSSLAIAYRLPLSGELSPQVTER